MKAEEAVGGVGVGEGLGNRDEIVGALGQSRFQRESVVLTHG